MFTIDTMLGFDGEILRLCSRKRCGKTKHLDFHWLILMWPIRNEGFFGSSGAAYFGSASAPVLSSNTYGWIPPCAAFNPALQFICHNFCGNALFKNTAFCVSFKTVNSASNRKRKRGLLRARVSCSMRLRVPCERSSPNKNCLTCLTNFCNTRKSSLYISLLNSAAYRMRPY